MKIILYASLGYSEQSSQIFARMSSSLNLTSLKTKSNSTVCFSMQIPRNLFYTCIVLPYSSHWQYDRTVGGRPVSILFHLTPSSHVSSHSLLR